MNQKPCSCYPPKSLWKEEPPESTHRYRVECARCTKFIKWGAEVELMRLRAGDSDIAIEEYRILPELTDLDRFLLSQRQS